MRDPPAGQRRLADPVGGDPQQHAAAAIGEGVVEALQVRLAAE